MQKIVACPQGKHEVVSLYEYTSSARARKKRCQEMQLEFHEIQNHSNLEISGTIAR